jgi:hypothetical protein
MILWQWSIKRDAWEFVTEANEPAQQAAVLRGYKRRNPKGTRFRWCAKEQGAPKKFRRRTAKEK